jgi:hypothetical protein
MSGIIICVAVAALGVDVGWKKLPDGGLEYIIQIEPGVLQSLRPGEEITSEVLPERRDIRAYRIQVGNEKLTRDPLPEAPNERSAGRPQLGPSAWGIGSNVRPSYSLKPPEALPANLAGKPLAEKQAGYVEGSAQATTAGASGPSNEPASSEQPARPWLPLSLASVALFTSLGANVYLGWLFHDARSRYRRLLARPTEAC